MTRVACLVLAGLLCTVGHAAPANVSLLALSIDATPEQVQTAAERIVFSFALAVNESLDGAAVAPTVEVLNTPNLAYFDPRAQRIVIPHWPTLDPALRRFFVELADSEEDAATLFIGLFNTFLVAHEMAHWLQWGLGVERDRYASEREANDIAVAFFGGLDGGDTLFHSLRPRLEAALARLADPTPPQSEEAQFFNSQYAALARDPYQYGYYQFRFILDSIDRRDELDFATLLAALIAE
ncbi:MAG: hypothetical protein AB1778_01925 [Candidatus Bipolaricaulota bacterium]